MNSCTISGVVLNQKNDNITVEIQPDPACAGCGAKIMCGSGQTRKITLKSIENFTSGDSVKIEMHTTVLLQITFLLYFAGVIFSGLFTYITAVIFKTTDVISAVIFIVIVLLYLPLCGKFLTKRYSRKISYVIEKI